MLKKKKEELFLLCTWLQNLILVYLLLIIEFGFAFFFLSLSLEETRLIREEASKISIIEQPKVTGKG